MRYLFILLFNLFLLTSAIAQEREIDNWQAIQDGDYKVIVDGDLVIEDVDGNEVTFAAESGSVFPLSPRYIKEDTTVSPVVGLS